MKSPVLFIIFNRPESTRRVFDAIKAARPPKLYISADGPRPNKDGENLAYLETRNVVNDQAIDWPCEVYRNYSNTNLGCKVGVSNAIDWFFKNEQEGIILEDDCLPNKSFFDFTDAMLEKYRNTEQVMQIRGTNWQFGKKIGDGDYYFSKSPHIWGWATWKRAWKKYEIDMLSLNEFEKSKEIYKIFDNKKIANFWISIFNHVKNKNVDTWDTQWAYTIIKSNGLSIVPNINLIENIGIGENATHTTKGPSFLNQKSNKLEPEGGLFKAPSNTTADYDADEREMTLLYIQPWYKWPERIIKKIFNILKSK